MIRKFILASMMTASSAVAFAGEQVWHFAEDHSINNTGYGAQVVVSSNTGSNVTITAWSSTGTGCDSVAGNGSISDTDSCIENAKLKSYGGGLGVKNRDEADNTPNHSIDNTNYNNGTNHDIDFDMVMLSFDEAVNITSFGAGWVWNDFDTSVVAYTDETTPFSGFGQANWGDILDQGWSLIDENVRGSGGSQDFNVQDDHTYSRHWLVGTFNSAFSSTHWTDSNDGLKLNGLTVMTHPDTGTVDANAPATAGILFGLIGFMMYRRKS